MPKRAAIHISQISRFSAVKEDSQIHCACLLRYPFLTERWRDSQQAHFELSFKTKVSSTKGQKSREGDLFREDLLMVRGASRFFDFFSYEKCSNKKCRELIFSLSILFLLLSFSYYKHPRAFIPQPSFIASVSTFSPLFLSFFPWQQRKKLGLC